MKKILNFFERINETRTFSRQYTMSAEWWETWKSLNIEKYDFSTDAFSGVYRVEHEGKIILEFDYKRSVVFSDKSPEFFKIDANIPKAKLGELEDKADELIAPPKTKKELEEEKAKKEKKKAESEANKSPEDAAADMEASLGI